MSPERGRSGNRGGVGDNSDVMNVAAILPAAGHGTRMGKSVSERYGAERKQFMKLDGVPILALTIRKFLAAASVREILVAVPEGSQEAVQDMLAGVGEAAHLRVVAGGRSRQESVGHCLDAISADIDVVAVHDAVRPFVPVSLIEEAVAQAAAKGAVILGLPAEETVKQVSREVIQATLPRQRIMLAQTPQAFTVELLQRAFRKAREDGFVGTDEAGLVEHLNEDVYVMRGDERNIKITRPHHMALAKLYYEQENRESPAPRQL